MQDPVISNHPPRQSHLYALKRWLTLIGLVLCGIALAGEILLMLGGFPLPLLPLLIVFTAGMALILWLGTILNPQVTATETGLILQPMLGRSSHVPWEAIQGVKAHTLMPVDEPAERLLVGRRRMPSFEGVWVVVRNALPVKYRVIAWLTGMGNVAVFGISDATHEGYQDLLALIKSRATR